MDDIRERPAEYVILKASIQVHIHGYMAPLRESEPDGLPIQCRRDHEHSGEEAGYFECMTARPEPICRCGRYALEWT